MTSRAPNQRKALARTRRTHPWCLARSASAAAPSPPAWARALRTPARGAYSCSRPASALPAARRRPGAPRVAATRAPRAGRPRRRRRTRRRFRSRPGPDSRPLSGPSSPACASTTARRGPPSLGALAFTQGDEIHMAPGRWRPETADGRRLLGHELGHVLQQREGRVRATSWRLGVGLNEAPQLEREADIVGERVERALGGESGGLVSPWAGPFRRAGAARRIHGAPIQRAKDPAVIDPTIEVDPPIPDINKPGFIDHSDGANIRSRPAELGGVPLTDPVLPPATRVFVSGRHPQTAGWWYVTASLSKTFVRGYVQDFRVNTDLPEIGATLYQIQANDTVEELARRKFSAHVTDGHDLRFYENVLLAVNQDKGRAGIKGSFQAPNIVGGGADNIRLEAGRRIWLVSPAFALAQKETVPDGSFSNGLVAKTRRALGHVQDIVQSVTDSPRHLGSVAGEYVDAIKSHLPEIIGVTAAFIVAEAASTLLAATPTGVGQLAAALIQLILALIAGTAAIEMGVEALRHAEQWLKLAWTAGGDEKKIAEASKEFLRMLVSIAIAALAVAGMRGNVGKGLKITQSLRVELPASRSLRRW
ncbi:eCIS core domain-containing protein [Nannocystis pusilla]|uniref:eCIS core domain-containing protein n=1 Tax=Nannocystis pusilla TaxID=889268 RepID=UPI003DA51233